MLEEPIEPTRDLRDYLDVLRRRKRPMLITVAVLVLAAALAAVLWPPTYQSTATILIQEQEVPPNLVQSTVTSYAMQRVQVITQRVMTRANLVRLIDKYHLYADRRDTDTTEQLVDRMRKDIGVQPISADVVDPRTGQPTKATIAFTLSFEGSSPGKVQRVANELTSLYLAENIKTRTEKASDAYSFLSGEAKRLKGHLDKLDQEIATLERHNLNRLPQVQDVNLQLVARTDRDLTATETQIRAFEGQRVYLMGQLAGMNPYTPLAGVNGRPALEPVEQLRLLRSQYISASAEYGARYPDVVRLRRQIKALEKKTGLPPDVDEQKAELRRARLDLTRDQAKYSDRYPDVVRLKKKVTALEAAIAKSGKSGKSGKGADTAAANASAGASAKPTNPAYVSLRAQLDRVDSQLKAYRAQAVQLKAKIARIDKRLMETPEVARRYEALRLDRNATAKQYQLLLAKQTDAAIAQQLERDQKGERFVLIDPPQLPERPIEPNRLAILLLGFVLSLGGGVGMAATLESMDRSVRGVKGIVAILEVPPLAAIPYLDNEADLGRRRRNRRIVWAAWIAAIVVALLLVQFFWMPLDVLWFRVLDKFNGTFGLK